jgi:hypothetical protein
VHIVIVTIKEDKDTVMNQLASCSPNCKHQR